jgi:hypothetical protein
MRTRQISHEQWPAFFSDFTQLHQDEHVHVETMGKGQFGAKSQLCDLALVGIVPAAPTSGQDEWIEILARDSDGGHASYSIAGPARVELAEENGNAIALQVESMDGSITMIRFEPPRENMPEGYTLA